MEYGSSLHLPEVLKRWVDGIRDFTEVAPPPPLLRGELDLCHVSNIVDPEEYLKTVTDWARSAWNAWSEHWPQARDWIRQAIAESA